MQDNNYSQQDFYGQQELIYKSAYVSIALLLLNVLIFILCISVAPFLYDKGAMVTQLILEKGQFYRLFSAIFLHADIEHLVNNMVMLALIGAIVEHYTGHGFYIFLYFASGLVGNMLSMAFEMRNDLSIVSIGASGAVMGLVGFVAIWVVINRNTFIRNKNTFFRLGLLLIFVVNACFFQEGANTMAHLGGFLAGIVLGIVDIILLKNNKNMEGLA
ncbi:MAG: rhomboid family intramembrane serine protease [Butyrivibrio sp.]|nr:rhomboid family intramembrane serine protease [Butyrivibrio sp.]